MRADRLLSILLLLQARGRMTARQLAGEMEVTERTIYRDINALSSAGVPVYGLAGPNGGFRLLESYRTNLTGLTAAEARALLMLRIPAVMDDLGLADALQAALLKLSAALPDARREEEERVRQGFHFDSRGWGHSTEHVPHLQTVHQAVLQQRKLLVTFRPRFATEIERLVAPYGLVAKTGTWHLVFVLNAAVRVRAVADFLDVRLVEERFDRPQTFDLAEFWDAWCAEHAQHQTSFSVVVRVSPRLLPELPRRFGDRIRSGPAQAHASEAAGWSRLVLTYGSLEEAREHILGFGRAIEVLEPYALRRSIRDYAEQIVDLYRA